MSRRPIDVSRASLKDSDFMFETGLPAAHRYREALGRIARRRAEVAAAAETPERQARLARLAKFHDDRFQGAVVILSALPWFGENEAAHHVFSFVALSRDSQQRAAALPEGDEQRDYYLQLHETQMAMVEVGASILDRLRPLPDNGLWMAHLHEVV